MYHYNANLYQTISVIVLPLAG